LRKAGKYVFFHSDGHIRAILPDLIDIGISALNSQLYCMDIEEIGREFAWKITFWGELDRQHIQPFGTPAEVREAVRRIRRALDRNRGGLFAQTEWGKLDPYENIDALFDEWQKPLDASLAGGNV
jgi:uroporphyrinogen decarboxylase